MSPRTIAGARFDVYISHRTGSLAVRCGVALAATLPDPYRTLEVQSWRADLVFAGVGLRPNSRKNRSGLLPSFQEASRAA